MKKAYILYIMILVTAFFISGCGEEKPPLAQKSMKMSGKWPFYNDEAREDLASNLLAKNYFLIFDGSGSMAAVECSDGERKINVAKKAVAEWSKTVPREANIGLYAFHKSGKSVLPIAPGGRDKFIQTIHKLKNGGKTPLSEAILYAYEECIGQARRQLGYGEYTIVVVTDGAANDQELLSSRIKTILDNSPINIFSIGFCIGAKHSLNQPGQTIYKAADNPAELRKGLREVLAESEIFDESEFSE